MAIPLLPETAPFTPAQRAWLNGFFAGAFGVENGIALNGHSNGAAHAPTNGHANAEPAAPVEDEPFPWHDPAMPLTDRMKLADGKPLERRLMASMAQLDCGACGYVCKTYSEAIASGAETDLSKCSPGGKGTAKVIKELLATRKTSSAVKPTSQLSNGTTRSYDYPVEPKGIDRDHPVAVPLLQCLPLTQPDSDKDVRFVAINLKGSGLSYEVGDALGVYPENCPDLVEGILHTLGARGDEPVVTPAGRAIFSYEALVKDYSVTKLSDRIVGLLADSARDSVEASALRGLMDDDPAGVLEWWDLLDVLEQFPSARPPVADLIAALPALSPRLYSISSSLKAHPDEVHLTVGVVRHAKANRQRKGVASTFLTERARPRQRVRVFAHSSPGFRLPAQDDIPVIMVGPGTGIAPFRAFLEERKALGAKGKSWLFFGNQRCDHDFLYRDELVGFQRDHVLTRLDTAFSRDQDAKIYVQHRMKENAADLWSWLQDGAHFYVCGDARRMALDVDRTLHDIVVEQGRMTAEAAKAFVQELTKAKRYLRDVY